jgi:hypothetical protein
MADRFPRVYVPQSRVVPLPANDVADEAPLVWANPELVEAVISTPTGLTVRFASGEAISIEDGQTIEAVTEMIRESWPYSDHLE